MVPTDGIEPSHTGLQPAALPLGYVGSEQAFEG